MKPLTVQQFTGFAFVLATLTTSAQEPVAAHTDFKKEIRRAYVFVPSATPTTLVEPQPVWATRLIGADAGMSTANDAQLVTLAPYRVEGTFRDSGLHAKITKQQRDAHTKQVLGRLGIGVHEVKLRKVTLEAATLFWIPISAGISW